MLNLRRLAWIVALTSTVLGVQFIGHSARLDYPHVFSQTPFPVLFSPQAPQQNTYPVANLFGVYTEGTLSTAAFVTTIQQPAAPKKTITFQGGIIYCAAGCNPTLEINGTAATATAGSVISINTAAGAATATAWTASNAGAGTVLYRYSIPASSGVALSASGLSLTTTASQNFTVRSDTISGNYRVLISWSEQ